MVAFDGLSRAIKENADGEAGLGRKRPNPIVHAIESTRFQNRMMPEDLVEGRARRLHAKASYEPWDDLDEVNQALWRHLAMIQLSQGVPAS